MNPETTPLLTAYEAALDVEVQTDEQESFRRSVIYGIGRLMQMEDLLDEEAFGYPEMEA